MSVWASAKKFANYVQPAEANEYHCKITQNALL